MDRLDEIEKRLNAPRPPQSFSISHPPAPTEIERRLANMRKPDWERLADDAEALMREADSLRGCSWMGSEPPWASLERDARDKLRLARILRKG